MPVIYAMIEDSKVALQYWSGRVTRDDMVTHERHHLMDPRITPGASVLVDARESHCGLTQEEVHEVIDALYANFPTPLRIKTCAFLVNAQTYALAEAL